MTEQTMVERVARAICEKSWIAKHSSDESRKAAIDANWHEFEDIARAAIEAMREPTDAMVDAGMTELPAFQAYRVMIDAALKTEGQ